MNAVAEREEIRIPAGDASLAGELDIPEGSPSVVVFAHGSGGGRSSPRNRFVSSALRDQGFGTLLFDLLTPEEGEIDVHTAHLRFDIGFLAERLERATAWLLAERPRIAPIGFFGASTGAAAALVTAARIPGDVGAIVSRGGRPALAGAFLDAVRAPVLLIVGGADPAILRENEWALDALRGEKRLHVVPEATHLFEEPGALEEVAREAGSWFLRHLRH